MNLSNTYNANLIYILIQQVTGRGGVEDTRLEAKAKDSLSEDGHSRGQGQECSRPRPRTKDTKHKCSPKKKRKRSSQKFFRRSPKKKKRSSQKFFKRSPLKNVFQKIFQALHKILTFQKTVLSSSRGQANFRGLEASRPRPRTFSRTPPLVTGNSKELYNQTGKEIQNKADKFFFFSCSISLSETIR